MASNKLNITIDFPPTIKVRWGWGGMPNAKYIEEILKNRLNEQIEFSFKIKKFMPAFEKIEINPSNEISPFWNQNWFPPLDGISLYTVLASYAPSKYIEIGSGNSTKFARLAITDQQLQTKITSIDPFPRAEIDAVSDVIFREGLEKVDLAVFDSLVEGDVVFFDGSHRSFQNSDVTVFFIEVMPRLKPGVIIGIHDIFWPRDYPENWLERYYNEQYLLGTYMLAKKHEFPLIFACNWMGINHSNLLADISSDLLKQNLNLAGKGLGGGCLWFSA